MIGHVQRPCVIICQNAGHWRMSVAATLGECIFQKEWSLQDLFCPPGGLLTAIVGMMCRAFFCRAELYRARNRRLLLARQCTSVKVLSTFRPFPKRLLSFSQKGKLHFNNYKVCSSSARLKKFPARCILCAMQEVPELSTIEWVLCCAVRACVRACVLPRKWDKWPTCNVGDIWAGAAGGAQTPTLWAKKKKTEAHWRRIVCPPN